jgi:hypothetical protein
VGIDVRLYHDDNQNVVLLRPERITADESLAARAADLEIGQMADVDRCFQNGVASGSLFFHCPREIHIESFDRMSPFKQVYAGLLSELSPSGEQNRRRFIHSLATLDSEVMVDGGWVLPLGQEAAIRDVTATYRSLPAIHFETLTSEQTPDCTQPVVFRSGTIGGRTYLYAVNDAPFRTTARVHIAASAACRMDSLGSARKNEELQPDATAGYFWEVVLEPYDLAAVRLSEPNVQCSAPHAAWPEAVESALSLQIRRLGARAAVLRNPPPLDVLDNPSFESAAGVDGQISKWTVIGQGNVSVQLDKTEKHNGQQSVKMTSNEPAVCLVSQPLAVPATGRLTLSVWLRAADAGRQPPLRLAIEGKVHGRDFARSGHVGLLPNGQTGDAIQTEWGQYILPVEDLPLEGLTSLRVRFELTGPGEVWIDDVQVFGLAFSVPEMVELSKLIALADLKLQNGEVGDCLRLLDGYWPRFLEENVVLPAGAIPTETIAARQPAKEDKPPEHNSWLGRMKDMLPDSLRF